MGQGQQVVLEGAAGDVYVAPFCRGNRRVIALNAESFSLKATREISQSTSVNKLTQNRSTRFSKSPNKMNETKSVEPKARNIGVMNEVIALLL